MSQYKKNKLPINKRKVYGRRWIGFVMASSLIIIAFGINVNFIDNTVSNLNDGTRYLRVAQNGSNDYQTLNEAIKDSQNGDTIIIESGLYTESVIIDKSINLIAANGSNVIIENRLVEVVLLIEANNYSIINIELLNTNPNSESRVGIKVTSNDNNIENCRCSGFSNEGYGIEISLSASNNTLRENECNDNTYGIFIQTNKGTSSTKLIENQCNDNIKTGIFLPTFRTLCLKNRFSHILAPSVPVFSCALL